MAKESIDSVVRVDPTGNLEGHGTGPKSAEGKVRKGGFMQVGESVDLSETPYSPNRKTGTFSGDEQ